MVTRSQLPSPRPQRALQRQILFLALAALSLTPWFTPAAALVLGTILALLQENPFPRFSRVGSKYLLQAAVVLLGFSMNLQEVLEAGAQGAVLAVGSITLTLGLGFVLGRWLQISDRASALIAVGTAICGGSAIAAVSTVIGAAEGEISVAMGTVFLLNSVALLTFPAIGHALHLTQDQFGTWAGVAIHDISSVVGAAAPYGIQALHTATAVKLSRALWIIPVTLLAGHWFRSQASPRGQQNSDAAIILESLHELTLTDTQELTAPAKPTPLGRQSSAIIPWFIGLFILASVARTLVPALVAWEPLLETVSTRGLTLTLFLIGTSLSRRLLRSVGWRPMFQGIILWIVISITSLGVIRWGIS